MRNGSLWSNVVFDEFDFETSDLEFEVANSSIWKHTTSCNKGVFWAQLSSNFQGFVILCLWWDPSSEQTGLWQLPTVPSVFKCDLIASHSLYVMIHCKKIIQLVFQNNHDMLSNTFWGLTTGMLRSQLT